MDTETIKRLDRIDKKLTALLSGQKKETWIGPSFLKDLTGWESEKMRQAREQGIVEHKRSDGGGWLYKLESIPEQFIKAKIS